MRCREARKWISSELLHQAAPGPEMQEHLSECARCAVAVRVARIERAVFRAIKPEAYEPDSFFPSRVLAHLRSQAFAGDRELWLSMWRAAIQMIPVGLAMVVLALAAAMFVAPRQEPAPSIMQSALETSHLSATERMILVEQKLDKERILETIVGEAKKNGD